MADADISAHDRSSKKQDAESGFTPSIVPPDVYPSESPCALIEEIKSYPEPASNCVLDGNHDVVSVEEIDAVALKHKATRCEIPVIRDAELATEIKRALMEAKDLAALQLQAEHIAYRIKPYLRAPKRESGYRRQPMETAPKKEDEVFLVRLPNNDVCETLAIQVSVFQGRMYSDCKDGLIDWGDAIVGADAWSPLPTEIEGGNS